MRNDSQKTQLIVILFAYIIFASIFGFAYRYAMNPDGISELRLAGYIAEGHFQQSVTSTWSPLITWIMALFIYFGFDGLTAARISIALCGVGLILCSWLLALRFHLSQNMRFISVLIAALLISFWTIQYISGDVLFAALLILLFYLITNPGILEKKMFPFYCGIVGGFSYLAHHYAFPFFIVYFPFQLILRGYFSRDKERFPWKKVFISWAVGIAGFIIITSIWIGLVSAKYGHLTISSKGGIAHSRMGPTDIDRSFPYFYGGLNKPNNAYSIHIFEDPSGLKFKTWSPFESKEYFLHQLKVIKENIDYMLDHFIRQSPFFTYAFVICVLVLITIALFVIKMNNNKKFLYAWFILTFSIYSSGFLLLIARSPRRFYALMVLFLFLSVLFFEELRSILGDMISERKKKLLTVYFLIIIVSAFALKPGIQLLRSVRNVIADEQVNPYKEIAEQIKTIQFPAPYAIIRTSQKQHTDYYLAYFIGKYLLGRPISIDVEDLTKELKEADAKSLLVFDNPEVVNKLNEDERYIHSGALKLKNYNKYLNPINAKVDEITNWDNEVNVYILH